MCMNYEGKPGSYTYTANALGKGACGVAGVGAQSQRDKLAQIRAGGAARLPGDQGGHLIAHALGGRNDPSNLDAQAREVNQKDQKNIERNVLKLASDPNHTVALSVQNYTSINARPDATMINLGLRDNRTGIIEEQHISFQNADHSLQESWNETAARYGSGIDPSQNAGLTEEQRAIADGLYGEEDSVDHSLGSGWTYMEFGQGPSSAAAGEGSAPESDFQASFLDGGEAEGERAEAGSGEAPNASDSEQPDASGDLSEGEGPGDDCFL